MAAEAMAKPGQQRLDGGRGSQAPLGSDLERQGTVLACMSSGACCCLSSWAGQHVDCFRWINIWLV